MLNFMCISPVTNFLKRNMTFLKIRSIQLKQLKELKGASIVICGFEDPYALLAYFCFVEVDSKENDYF